MQWLCWETGVPVPWGKGRLESIDFLKFDHNVVKKINFFFEPYYIIMKGVFQCR